MYFLLKISLFLLILISACSKKVLPDQQEAVFGAGCFWTLDYYFEKMDGVSSCKCIYTDKGSEAVLIKYDPQKISYNKLCKIFFDLHDPTTNFKPQYSSIIQVNQNENKQIALDMIKLLKKTIKVKTTVENIGAYTFPDQMHENWHENKNSIPKCSIPKTSILHDLKND